MHFQAQPATSWRQRQALDVQAKMPGYRPDQFFEARRIPCLMTNPAMQKTRTESFEPELLEAATAWHARGAGRIGIGQPSLFQKLLHRPVRIVPLEMSPNIGLQTELLVVLIDKGAGFVLYKLLEDTPGVKGAVDLLATLPFIMMAVANLGLATSGVYFLRKGMFGLRQVAETSSLVAVAWGTGVAAVAIVASQTVLPLIRPNWNFDLGYVVPISLCVPFLLAAFYLPAAMARARRLGRLGRILQVASGVVMLAAGLAIATGEMTRLAIWILEAFPWLARLG